MTQTEPRRAGRLEPGPPGPSPWLVEARATAALALPLVLTQVAQIGINTTDVLLTGRLGPQSLASASLAMNLYMTLWLFGLGLVNAVAPLAAQAEGAGQPDDVRRAIRQGLWIAAAYSLPAMFVLWHTEAILLLFGQEPGNAALAGDYMRAMMWSFPTSLWLIVLRNFAAAVGHPSLLMIVLIGGITANLFADLVLMFGYGDIPALGLVGAGIASSFVYASMLVAFAMIVMHHGHLRRYQVLVRLWRSDWERFRELFRIGWPIGTSIVAETGLFAAAGMLMGLIGTAELAAHAVAMQCIVIAFMVPLGISQATTMRVGLAVGAGTPWRVSRAGWTGIGLGPVVLLVSALVFLLLPETLIAAFDVKDPVVIGHAVVFLTVAAFFQVFDGTQVIAQGALRGLKDTRVPMLYALFSYWLVGLPLCALLGFEFELGGLGIWIGLATSLALASCLLVQRFRGLERRLSGLAEQPA